MLYGRSDEDALVPYQSFVEALGQWVAACPPERLRRAGRACEPELSRLLPQLAQRLPDLQEPPPREPDTERFLLFEAVSSLLAEESSVAPIVLVLDDLHWADKSTLALLKHLARSPYESRLLILAPYREAQQFRTDHLSDTLAYLHREHRCERLSLGGLDETDVGVADQRAVGARSGARVRARDPRRDRGQPVLRRGDAPPPGRVRGDLREGRPLGVGPARSSELGIPEGLKEVIRQRLARLHGPRRGCSSLASDQRPRVQPRRASSG